MGMTNATIPEIAKALIGETFTEFDVAGAHIGVGSDATAFNATQTDLLATGAIRKAVDSAPTRSGSDLTFIATFATNEANFNWREWAVFNGSGTSAVMLQRKVETASALGTKTTASQWVMTATVQLQAG